LAITHYTLLMTNCVLEDLENIEVLDRFPI